jgi:hypothetical protein
MSHTPLACLSIGERPLQERICPRISILFDNVGVARHHHLDRIPESPGTARDIARRVQILGRPNIPDVMRIDGDARKAMRQQTERLTDMRMTHERTPGHGEKDV